MSDESDRVEGMAEARFTAVFEPEDEGTHEIDAAALGEALIALSSLLTTANRSLNGDRAEVQIRVEANPKQGSILIDLVVNQGLLDQVKSLLVTGGFHSAKEVLEFLGISGGTAGAGLIAFLKWKKNRAIEKKAPGPAPGTTSVTIADSTVVVNNFVIQLADDAAVRAATERLADTLGNPGVKALAFRDRGVEVERLARRDVEALQRGPAQEPEVAAVEPVLSSRATMVVEPMKVWLDRSDRENKWQFSDGGRLFNAEILDQHFLEEVRAGRVAFRVGTTMRVEMAYSTRRTAAGLQTDFSVVKVLEVTDPPIQPRLFDEPA